MVVTARQTSIQIQMAAQSKIMMTGKDKLNRNYVGKSVV
jgi:hypothetical protein